MLKRIEITELDDYFIDLGKRSDKGVFFNRINGYSTQIHSFIKRYYETARLNGVIIEGKIPNPDNNNLAYYNEIMGTSFQMSHAFISSSLKKWLPRMTDSQRENVAGSIYDTLLGLRKAGKNDNMLKNAYIKFMCWLYYKFERIISRLGDEKLPKILYEGSISSYELLLMSVLSLAGCDIVLLQYKGDADYLKVDPGSLRSSELRMNGLVPFPPSFSLNQIRKDIQDAVNIERLYGEKPKVFNCTNAWISGKILEDIRRATGARGTDGKFFYNCFCRIMGVEDRLTYPNELYQLLLEMKSAGRKVVIINNRIPQLTPDEIDRIQRGNYRNIYQLITNLSQNISYNQSQELQPIMRKAFVDVVLDESRKNGSNLNRIANRAVYLLCWLQRYQNKLFGSWKMSEIGCFSESS